MNWGSFPTRLCLAILLVLGPVPACSTYHPLEDEDLPRCGSPASVDTPPGLHVTFLGNTTLYFTDGETGILVDAYLSRPGPLTTLVGKLEPNQRTVAKALAAAGIGKGDLDAVLVGHSHHDHALDVAAIAGQTGAMVYGSASTGHVYHGGLSGSEDGDGRFVEVPPGGHSYRIGDFTVSFRPSNHVPAVSGLQNKVVGCIHEDVEPPAHFSEYKHGPVYALHLDHPKGSALVTTTAGSTAGAVDDLQAETVFLAVGLLSRMEPDYQQAYWAETVEAVGANRVVPIHWDSFTTRLKYGGKHLLTPQSKGIEDVESLMETLRELAGDSRKLCLLDAFESVSLED